jgi:hypothetical protein
MAEQIRIAERMNKGWARWWPVVFCLLAAAVLAYAVTRTPDYPVYEYRHVKVLSQVAPNKWWMERADGQFLWNGCPDFPNGDVIWPGYVMNKFRYEDRGKCKSILRPDLGVWWQRDATTKNVEVIDEQR